MFLGLFCCAFGTVILFVVVVVVVVIVTRVEGDSASWRWVDGENAVFFGGAFVFVDFVGSLVVQDGQLERQRGGGGGVG